MGANISVAEVEDTSNTCLVVITSA